MIGTEQSYDRSRPLNIIWTISKDYRLSPDLFWLHNFYQDQKISENSMLLYVSAIIGGIHKYLDSERLSRFVLQIELQVSDADLFKEIVWLCAEEYCAHLLMAELPGIAEIRKAAIASILDGYFFKNTKNLRDEIRKAYYLRKSNKSSPSNNKVFRLIQDIERVRSLDSEKEFVLFLEKLIQSHFHFEFSFMDGMNEKNKTEKKRNAGGNHPHQNLTKSVFYTEEIGSLTEEYTSAEFSSNVSGMDIEDSVKELGEQQSIQVNQDPDERIGYKVESIFGKQSLVKEDVRRLEKLFSVGIHEGQKIYITKGIFSKNNKDEYRFSQMNRQREENVKVFDNQVILYRRNIARLKEAFVRTLSKYQDFSYYRSDSGKLDASIAWRVSKIRDTQIFSRGNKDVGSSFVVDILLDSSGSQMDRQSVVAIQGYILSEALSLCHIPNRVSSFNNFMNFNVIRMFRDYDDEISKSKNIFAYYAVGSNRDGLSISVTVDSLLRRSEENKILIVLSDGKPNDMQMIQKNTLLTKTKDYTGKKAVDDTAFAVRKARMKGIAVLGVFTGEQEDLEAEKLIYGKDFAFINNIEYFADIVGLYLKRQITNMLDDF